jgi:hypothetical protein
MASHEPQTITLSRKVVLLITLIGIGVLTVCYVLGVHVGRQSVAFNNIDAEGVGGDLCQLPATIQDQIKTLDDGRDIKDTLETTKSNQQSILVNNSKSVSDNKLIVPVKVNTTTLLKPEPRGTEKKPEGATSWTIQLISTPDAKEAQRMIGRVQAAGFSAVTVNERGVFKVRLSKAGSRETIDAIMAKLKNRGFKPFAVKIG